MTRKTTHAKAAHEAVQDLDDALPPPAEQQVSPTKALMVIVGFAGVLGLLILYEILVH